MQNEENWKRILQMLNMSGLFPYTSPYSSSHTKELESDGGNRESRLFYSFVCFEGQKLRFRFTK
jgi:hypothetical protein